MSRRSICPTNARGFAMATRLEDLGWRGEIPCLAEDQCLGRVAIEHRGRYVVYLESKDTETDAEPWGVWAEVSGKLRKQADSGVGPGWPTVGDWVVLDLVPNSDHGVIRSVEPRFSRMLRKQAGRTSNSQVLAANIDRAFLVQSLEGPLNFRKIERYLSLAHGANIEPVLILTKADLADDWEGARQQAQDYAPGVPVHALSAVRGWGLEDLTLYLNCQQTIVVLGPSGVGKSTLINWVLGRELQKTQEISDIGRGRHTTTHRELLRHPFGGWLIDTPGLRELALLTEDGLEETFSDLGVWADRCRFRDCTHQHEPGCAVREAVAQGELPPDRLDSFQKLEAESKRQALATDARARAEQNKKWKAIHQAQKQFYKSRPRFD